MWYAKYDRDGETVYGTVYTHGKEYEAHKRGGIAKVLDTFGTAELVPVSHITWIKEGDFVYMDALGHHDFNDEFHAYVRGEFVRAKRRMERNPDEGLNPGDIFTISVADGAAYYVVLDAPHWSSECLITWREFGGGDRYTDHHFGWGGVFKQTDVKRYVDSERTMRRLFSKDAS